MKNRLRLGIAIALLLITLLFFVHYISDHKYLITKLSHMPPSTIIWLLLLYVVWFGALGLILLVTVLMCKKTLKIGENFLLNGYSTLVNFFIPGQGGIVVRGVYLKKVKKIAVRKYIFVSLVYFMFYALISVTMLLAASRAWWQTVGGIIVVGAISFGIIFVYKKKFKIKFEELELSASNLAYLFLATLLQAVIQTTIFAVELRTFDSHISLSQAITYTGAANFALFVALTPGAIGIREAFLIFSQKLHHISSANIVAANLVDRSVFLVFLGLLFLLTISFHAKYKFLWQKSDSNPKTGENLPIEPPAK